MSSDRQSSPLLLIAVMLSAALGLYVASYYWRLSVARETVAVVSRSPRTIMVEKVPLYAQHPRIDSWLNTLFVPVHTVDRALRPRVWEKETVTLE